MKSSHCLRVVAVAAAALLSAGAHAAVTSVFTEDFENGLGQWTDVTTGGPAAAVVADPLRAGNQVVTFTRPWAAGSLFSNDAVTTTGTFRLSFDYLGLPTAPQASGGFIGVADPGQMANQLWLAGTGDWPTPTLLIDDGQWHRYTLTLPGHVVANPVRLMLEDWVGAGAQASNAFFDNLVLTDAARVPTPGSLSMTLLALAVAGVALWRRRVA